MKKKVEKSTKKVYNKMTLFDRYDEEIYTRIVGNAFSDMYHSESEEEIKVIMNGLIEVFNRCYYLILDELMGEKFRTVKNYDAICSTFIKHFKTTDIDVIHLYEHITNIHFYNLCIKLGVKEISPLALIENIIQFDNYHEGDLSQDYKDYIKFLWKKSNVTITDLTELYNVVN